MVCVLSPSLWLSFRPLRLYKNTEGLSQTLERAGYPYFYLFGQMGQALKIPWRQLEQHPGEL